jgi:hypothetical protein
MMKKYVSIHERASIAPTNADAMSVNIIINMYRRWWKLNSMNLIRLANRQQSDAHISKQRRR